LLSPPPLTTETDCLPASSLQRRLGLFLFSREHRHFRFLFMAARPQLSQRNHIEGLPPKEKFASFLLRCERYLEGRIDALLSLSPFLLFLSRMVVAYFLQRGNDSGLLLLFFLSGQQQTPPSSLFLDRGDRGRLRPSLFSFLRGVLAEGSLSSFSFPITSRLYGSFSPSPPHRGRSLPPL